MGKRSRNIGVAPNEVYHLYNRGVMRRDIFVDNRDWTRFLFLVLFLQSSSGTFDHVSRLVSSFVRHSMFDVPEKKTREIVQKRNTRLIAFCLRPNHFHLLVQEVTEGGVAKYLQRLGNSHTKYFNTKYQSNGHLFQSRYQSVRMADNDQLLYTSAYIHKHTPRLNYEWSSYQDYVQKNRWPDLLDPSLILGQFTNGQEYAEWLRTSSAKESEFGKHSMLDD